MLLVAAVAAAFIAALTVAGDRHRKLVGNGVAALDAPAGAPRRLVHRDTGSAPSNVAVGEAGIWVLSQEDRTRRTHRPGDQGGGGVQDPRRAGRHRGGRGSGVARTRRRATAASSRASTRVTRGVTRSVRLRSGDYPGDIPFQNWNWAYPGIAVGAGAVWVINDDRDRVPDRSGGAARAIATIDVDAIHDRSGRRGRLVREAGDDLRAVVRIDPETNRAGRRRSGSARATCPRSPSPAGSILGVFGGGRGVSGESSRGRAGSRGRSTLGSAVTDVAAGAGGALGGQLPRAAPSRGSIRARTTWQIASLSAPCRRSLSAKARLG